MRQAFAVTGHGIVEPPLESNQPCLHTRAALHIALRRPYKNSSGSPPGLLVGAHPVGKSTHTFRDSKLSFVAREVKRAALWGMSPCAIWCETVDSNHAERGVRGLPRTLRAAAL